jgi:hypothetical protein
MSNQSRNFEPAVDTLAMPLTEKFQALRSTVNSLQTAFAGIEAGQQGKDGAMTAGPLAVPGRRRGLQGRQGMQGDGARK